MPFVCDLAVGDAGGGMSANARRPHSLPLSLRTRSSCQPAACSSVAGGGRAMRSARRSARRAGRRRGRPSREPWQSIAVICQTGPAAPCRRPTKKQIHADALAGALLVDVRLRLGLAWRLKRRPVAGDQRQPLRRRVELVPDERLVHPLGETSRPPHSGRANCAASRSNQARVAAREGDDLLDHGDAGSASAAAAARAEQNLKARPLHVRRLRDEAEPRAGRHTRSSGWRRSMPTAQSLPTMRRENSWSPFSLG